MISNETKSQEEVDNARGKSAGGNPIHAEGQQSKACKIALRDDARERKSAMREDRSYGHDNPSSRTNVILAAANLYCSICDARPCYLLATAAATVVQEQ